jgi:hypothetical protein
VAATTPATVETTSKKAIRFPMSTIIRREDPGHRSYFSFATFSDPDGNTWLFQEITTGLPGRGLSNLDVSTLTELLIETEQHHGEYEPTAPKHHWSGWYAAYIAARQDGKTPEEADKLGKLQIEGSQ